MFFCHFSLLLFFRRNEGRGWVNYEDHDRVTFERIFHQPLDINSRLALLQILEERYDRKSMIIVSQLPLDKWYDYIAEPTLADAIMDRLVNNSIHIELKGESMRRKKKK